MISRKAQIQGTFLKIVFSILILVIIFAFMVDSIGSIKERSCEAEYSRFINEFRSLKKNLDFGEKITEEFIIPCDNNKVIFVDSSVRQSLVALEDYPFLNNELKDRSSNVFFLKDDLLKKSLLVEDISIAFPYFRCYESIGNRVVLKFSKGISSDLFGSKDDEYDCMIESPRSISLKSEDIQKLLKDIKDSSQIYNNLKESDVISSDCNVTREFVTEGNLTSINIMKNEGCNVLLFEKIPKCAISSLEIAMKNGDIIFEEEIMFNVLEDDPLMVWHFDQTEDELLYTIKKFIDENCKDQFVSSAFDFEEYNKSVEEIFKDYNIPSGLPIEDSLTKLRDSNLKLCPECMRTLFEMVSRYDSYQVSGAISTDELDKMKFFLDTQVDQMNIPNKESIKEDLDIVYGWILA